VNATVMCALRKGYNVVVVEDAHGTRGGSAQEAGETIDDFNAQWAKAGAELRRTQDISFR